MLEPSRAETPRLSYMLLSHTTHILSCNTCICDLKKRLTRICDRRAAGPLVRRAPIYPLDNCAADLSAHLSSASPCGGGTFAAFELLLRPLLPSAPSVAAPPPTPESLTFRVAPLGARFLARLPLGCPTSASAPPFLRSPTAAVAPPAWPSALCLPPASPCRPPACTTSASARAPSSFLPPATTLLPAASSPARLLRDAAPSHCPPPPSLPPTVRDRAAASLACTRDVVQP
eukprot:7138657-Prymnesium_polylepis.1